MDLDLITNKEEGLMAHPRTRTAEMSGGGGG